jgi:hypothetical protein
MTFKIILEKGSIDTLNLREVVVKITPEGEDPFFVEFPELRKLRIKERKLDWDNPFEHLKLTMSPGESLHFGRTKAVAKGVPVSIELGVTGGRKFWDWFQWRCSVSCPPVIKTE